MKNHSKSLLKSIALTVVFTAPPATASADASQFLIKGTGAVSYVVDGDTLDIRADDSAVWGELRQKAIEAQTRYQRDMNIDRIFDSGKLSFRTRIGNINTPESVHRDKSKNTPAGRRAAEYARSLISRKNVEFVCWDIGYYGRPICSVLTAEFDFGITMISAGHTPYITKYSRHPFWHDEYAKAAKNSR